MKRFQISTLLCSLCAVLFYPLSAGAASISDRLRIVDQKGGVQFDKSTNETVPEFSITTAGTALLVPTGTVVSQSITLQEADKSWSDIIRMTVIPIGANDNLLFQLISDSGTTGLPASEGLILQEMNGEQEYTKEIFGVANAANAPFRIFVTSDLDTVPEPSSLAMFLSSWAFVTGYILRRRHTRKAVSPT